jgi:5-methylcytosine-specific restriction endonuclease McrA
MKRQEFSKRIKLEAFTRSKGICEGCTARLSAGQYAYDHIKRDTDGGLPTLENCAVLCTPCHTAKTAGEAPIGAKNNRVRNKHLGIKKRKRTIPGRRFNGDPIPARWK